MTDSLSVGRQSALLDRLRQLVEQRAPAEEEVPAAYRERNREAEQRYQAQQQEITQRHESQKTALDEEHTASRRAAVSRFESDHAATQRQYDQVRREALSRAEAAEGAARQRLREAQWEAQTVFEATKNGPLLKLREVTAQIEARWQELQSIHRSAIELLRHRWLWREYPEPQPTELGAEEDATRRFVEAVTDARKQLHALSKHPTASLLEGARPVWMFFGIWLLTVYPCGTSLGWSSWHWLAASFGSAALLGFGLTTWIYRTARRECGDRFTALRQTLADADVARSKALENARRQCETERAAILQRLQAEMKRADDAFEKAMVDLSAEKQRQLAAADERYPAQLAEIAARRDRDLESLDARHARQTEDNDRRFETEAGKLLESFTRQMSDSDQRYRDEWNALSDQWRAGTDHFCRSIDAAQATCDGLLPDWSGEDWKRWTPPQDNPPAIRFGTYALRLDQIEHGIPSDDRLVPERTEFTLPALLPFPERSLLMLRAGGAGLTEAVRMLQATMLRMLTAIPASKVRFTIVDPVGLGENFSAFMHLADYDEKLVASRIWTEQAHIDQRLGDLTEHMETVLQVYLRNEFDSIQEYNAFAGELAEPYRVLVVANFPAGFSENAAKRLRSIVASGARCGVFTLMSVDEKLRLPRDFHMSDLEPHAFPLQWKEDRFVWEHAAVGDLPLASDVPPPAERFTRIVRAVGEEVLRAGRVEVPFSCAVPEEDRWWTAPSRDGLDVPLGRAGAKKLQHLQLGKGTSQHVLVAGKTGSGKSTLWHALITNTAIRYSPDEVELYLVDFKKGVEFKAYATSRLPHARVVAIESEREFGLSVLERLDAELRERGDLFRSLGVQDVQGYRAARPEQRMPRVLLVIDEFQELFVEDDRVAQGAALLLDRLVRQGRAFGIHVLLGSQTLAGAYSLPRSTIGQMAVRVALQCSESDAHLILSEENTAARLLTRPGEAIYNDANGLYEGNHPFQVVWLPDDERTEYLKQIGDLAVQRGCDAPPAIVFEGNEPAELSGNASLVELLSAPTWPEVSPQTRAWLGSAVAIKPPTEAAFARQSGANLLIVGHREDLALGMMASSLVCVAAQHAPEAGKDGSPGARFYVLDGLRPDSSEAGFFDRLAHAVPHDVRVVAPRDAGAAVHEIAGEVARRQESGTEDAPPIYLMIHNANRFRDLRRSDDDYGFSRFDEDRPASPAQQLATILREGPPLGVHTILWCDTYNAVSNTLDRQGLREVEMRVLFPMNATDSSNLVDSTAAAQLGVHRALLYNEGMGYLEKFRPYAIPSAEWLAWVRERLLARGGATAAT